MIKMAVFCPRLPDEPVETWQIRHKACRQYLRQVHQIDALEFETLEHLQIN